MNKKVVLLGIGLIVLLLFSSLVISDLVTRGAGDAASSDELSGVSAPTARCRDNEVCKGIDRVWQILNQNKKVLSVGGIEKNSWDPATGTWVSFEKLYRPAGVTKPSQVIVPSASTIVQVALGEYNRWKQGAVDEGSPTGRQIVEKEYFPACKLSIPPDAVGIPWSAAFISYVLKKAGLTDFPANNCYHTNYFRNIKEGKYPICKVYPMSQAENIKSGDVLCACRDTGCPISFASFPTEEKNSHCDIVVERQGDAIKLIGGNVGDTVTLKEDTISRSPSEGDYFGFISCELTKQTLSDFVFSDDPNAQFKDTTHLNMIAEEASKAGVDPCYALVNVAFESQGRADVVGMDQNVASCDVPARRKYIIERSPAICSSYADAPSYVSAREACRTENNACIQAIKDKSIQEPKLTKDDFCSPAFSGDYSYGIGLGQVTPSIGEKTITRGGKIYTHCDLFDPKRNVEAMLSLIKEKIAISRSECAGNEKCVIEKTFEHYVGGGNRDKRVAAFNICQNKKQN